VRARWKIEELARGQWQLIVTELPPGTSTQKVLEEIEEITNPKVKAGKKALSLDQTQLKASMLALLDATRDESNREAAVRLVFEPKTSKIEQSELITALLAHTSLETTSSINLTAIGIDGRPTLKSLRQLLLEWIEFRAITIERRSRHRLDKVLDRIHILEGRQLVLLNIDEVIAIIRRSDEPKAALIERFKLSDRQAEDILEIRLRQLARLEAIKIEGELKELREEQSKLEEILNSPTALRRLMVKEIESDAKQYGDPAKDPRRTLIQAEKKTVAELKVVDEPVTVVVSAKGWVRARTGHGHDPASFAFKSGDDLYGTFECRTVDTLLVFGTPKDKVGRVYSVPVALLPGARGDGQPITTLIELESGTTVVHYFAGPASAQLLVSTSGGYGFIASVDNMVSRQKAGKAFISCGEGETVCKPSPIEIYMPLAQQNIAQAAIKTVVATHVACASTGGRILTFELSELKAMANGGRGLMLIDLDAKDTLAGAAAYTRSVNIIGIGRGGKAREEQLEIRSLNNARAARGRKGKAADLGFKPTGVVRVE
jgi:topoisomerase IV subunit A